MSEFEQKVSTKERLLIAAEKLFAEKGFADVSLRDITTAAEANVSSVSYYYSSKDALTDEVIQRHIFPVNEARLFTLKALRGASGKEAIALRDILDSFLRPMVERMRSSSLRNDLFRKIMGYCMADRAHQLPPELDNQMKIVLGLYIKELKFSLPQLNPELVVWRLHFSFGAVAHALMFSDRLEKYGDQDIGSIGTEEMLERLVDYCIGGLLAEVTPPKDLG